MSPLCVSSQEVVQKKADVLQSAVLVMLLTSNSDMARTALSLHLLGQDRTV